MNNLQDIFQSSPCTFSSSSMQRRNFQLEFCSQWTSDRLSIAFTFLDGEQRNASNIDNYCIVLKEIWRALPMTIDVPVGLCFLLVQQLLLRTVRGLKPIWLICFSSFEQINADELCYYLNQSSAIVATRSGNFSFPVLCQSHVLLSRCPNECCSGTATSPTTACCSTMSWSSL